MSFYIPIIDVQNQLLVFNSFQLKNKSKTIIKIKTYNSSYNKEYRICYTYINIERLHSSLYLYL